MKERAKVLFAVLFLGWGCLGVRLIYLQIIKHAYYRELARKEATRKVKLHGRRGDILDRNGIILATNVKLYTLYARPKEMKNKEEVIRVLSSSGISSEERLRRILNSGYPIVLVEKGIEEEIKERINLPGIYFVREWSRFYPLQELCGNLIGFTGNDLCGLSGIECSMDKVLKGRDGWRILQRRPIGTLYPVPDYPQEEPEEGCDVYLTIDSEIQALVEEVLRKGVERWGAKKGCGIVLDARTGEIYAMATVPSYNPNLKGKGNPEERKNMAVEFSFEPGSIFKVVLACAWIEKGYQVDEIVADTDHIEISGITFRDISPHGPYTMREAVVHSSNVGFINIGRKIGGREIYRYAKKFGFGCPTGIPLPGEAEGIVPSYEKIKGITLASISFGQGISVTPLQIVLAYQAIANGGTLMKPILVKEIKKRGKVVFQARPEPLRRVVKKETAELMLEILEEVVEKGTAKNAKIPGVRVGGKTGTAQKAGKGGYMEWKFVSSFVGIVPLDNPKFVIGIFIDEPQKGHLAGVVAAPLFREIARRLIHLYPYSKEIAGLR